MSDGFLSLHDGGRLLLHCRGLRRLLQPRFLVWGLTIGALKAHHRGEFFLARMKLLSLPVSIQVGYFS